MRDFFVAFKYILNKLTKTIFHIYNIYIHQMKIKVWPSIIWFSVFLFFSTFVFWQSISDIDANFCNDGILSKDLTFSTNSAKLNEICTKFTNNTQKDISIKIWFPDGTITNDEYKKQACKWEWNIEDFWKYIIQKNKIVTIPAKESIIEKNYIRFPWWFSWIVHWCQTYFLDTTDSDAPNLVNIVVRKRSYIDILVWWKFKREIVLERLNKVNNLWTNKKINTTFNLDSTLSLKLSFKNSWDIDESFIWSGKIFNKFWFSKDFDIKQTKLISNSKEVLIANMGRLPFYGWVFQIQISWNIQPQIDFNKESLDSKLKDPINIEEETTIIIIPRNIIILIIVIIIMIFTIKHFKKKKNNFDQQVQI